MIKFVENLRNALYGVFVTDKNTRYEEYQEDSRRKYEAYIDMLVKENLELKAKLKGFENGEVAWQGDMDATIKQNLKLKATISKMETTEKELKAQIKPLEDRICSLRRKNASLENKVEKMKCCGNCNDYLASVCKCGKINEYRICDSVCNDWS